MEEDQQILDQFEILDLWRSLKAISTKWHDKVLTALMALMCKRDRKKGCEQQMWRLPERVIWPFYCSLSGFVFESDCNVLQLLSNVCPQYKQICLFVGDPANHWRNNALSYLAELLFPNIIRWLINLFINILISLLGWHFACVQKEHPMFSLLYLSWIVKLNQTF